MNISSLSSLTYFQNNMVLDHEKFKCLKNLERIHFIVPRVENLAKIDFSVFKQLKEIELSLGDPAVHILQSL